MNTIIWGAIAGSLIGLAKQGYLPASAAAIGVMMANVFFLIDLIPDQKE